MHYSVFSAKLLVRIYAIGMLTLWYTYADINCCYISDQMGNKGAFITLTTDLKPKFTSYDAVVSPVWRGAFDCI